MMLKCIYIVRPLFLLCESQIATCLLKQNYAGAQAQFIDFEFELNYWTGSILGPACSPITNIDHKLIS